MTYERTEAAILDDQQTSIAGLLTEVARLTPMILTLTTTHQRGLGFATYDALQAQDAALRAERQNLKDLLAESLRRGVLPSAGYTTGAGESPNPGNLAAISVEAEIWTALAYLVRRLIRDQATRGICTLTRIPTEPEIPDLLVGIRALVWQTPNMRLLGEIHRELTQLRDAATHLVDGNDRTVLGDCPHCGERTLVVYFAQDLVRCDRNPKSGRFEPCTCPDPLCDCKERPVVFRHEWHRSRGTKPDGWYTLDRLINPDRSVAERMKMIRDLEHPEDVTA